MARKKLIITALAYLVYAVTVITVVLPSINSEPFSAPATSVQPQAVQNTTLTPKPAVDELNRLVNEKRAEAGVKPLNLDPLLNRSAQDKANEMISKGYYGHYDKEGKDSHSLIERTGIKCVWTSENMTAAVDSREAINEWMKSESHRKAMLNARYETEGFGVAIHPDGYYYVVQHFCDIM